MAVQLELDPQSYAIIEERYSNALQLAKKHQVAPENLVAFHQSLSQELAKFSHDESRINVVIEELENSITDIQSNEDSTYKLIEDIQVSFDELPDFQDIQNQLDVLNDQVFENASVEEEPTQEGVL